MKKIITALAIFASTVSFSQVGIGTNTPSSKSILDLTATDKGLLLPRMTTAQRTAIAPNATTDKGMQVFDTDFNCIYFWTGTLWRSSREENVYGIDGDVSPTTAINRDMRFTNGGSFNIDQNTFVVDATNNRVGIGTTLADKNLTVTQATSGEVVRIRTTEGGSGSIQGSSSLGFSHFNTTVVNPATTIESKEISNSNHQADLIFNTVKANADVAPTEAMRITSTGNVAIGTPTPDNYAKLDVASSNQGILVPRINLTSATLDLNADGDSSVANQPVGLLVFNTGTTLVKGFYFWNGTEWVNVGAASGGSDGDAWAVTGEDTANSIVRTGAIAIGSSAPLASSILDLSTITNKSFNGPKVALTSNTDIITIPSPATGALVYNTGAAGLTIKGYFFWNGLEWRNFYDVTGASPAISTLDCGNAALTPGKYTALTAYNGFMKVPYSDGNGAAYGIGTAITSTGVTGLTATLQPGTLAYGSGELTYKITGTPNGSSPLLASFTLPTTFGATGCTASVGNGALAGVSGAFASKGIDITTTTITDSELCLGDLCIRYDSSTLIGNIQLKHLNEQIYWITYYHWGTNNDSNVSYDSGTTNANTWQNIYYSGNTQNTEGVKFEITVVEKVSHKVFSYVIQVQLIKQSDSGDTDDKLFMRIYQN